MNYCPTCGCTTIRWAGCRNDYHDTRVHPRVPTDADLEMTAPARFVVSASRQGKVTR